MAEAQKKTNLDYVNEIWNIADYVRAVSYTHLGRGPPDPGRGALRDGAGEAEDHRDHHPD